MRNAARASSILLNRKNAPRGSERFSPRNGGTIIHHMARCQPKGRKTGRETYKQLPRRRQGCRSPTATAQVCHRTRATQKCTPHGTLARRRIPKEQNPHSADVACSGIRVGHPDAPRATHLQYLQTRRVHIRSKLCSHKLATVFAGPREITYLHGLRRHSRVGSRNS